MSTDSASNQPEQTKEVQCSICLDAEVGEFGAFRCLALHCFHKKCLNAWLVSHPTCPLCRSQEQPTLSHHYATNVSDEDLCSLLHSLEQRINAPVYRLWEEGILGRVEANSIHDEVRSSLHYALRIQQQNPPLPIDWISVRCITGPFQGLPQWERN